MIVILINDSNLEFFMGAFTKETAGEADLLLGVIDDEDEYKACGGMALNIDDYGFRIISLYIAENKRRLGAATALLNYLDDLCEKEDIPGIRATYILDDETEGFSELLKSRGYTEDTDTGKSFIFAIGDVNLDVLPGRSKPPAGNISSLKKIDMHEWDAFCDRIYRCTDETPAMREKRENLQNEARATRKLRHDAIKEKIEEKMWENWRKLTGSKLQNPAKIRRLINKKGDLAMNGAIIPAGTDFEKKAYRRENENFRDLDKDQKDLIRARKREKEELRKSLIKKQKAYKKKKVSNDPLKELTSFPMLNITSDRDVVENFEKIKELKDDVPPEAFEELLRKHNDLVSRRDILSDLSRNKKLPDTKKMNEDDKKTVDKVKGGRENSLVAFRSEMRIRIYYDSIKQLEEQIRAKIKLNRN